MKKLLLLSLFWALVGCTADETVNPVTTDATLTARPKPNNPNHNVKGTKVLLLQVDYLTHTFEGGTELSFATTNGFSIATEYDPPGDFGGVTLRYAQNDGLLFSGTIIWMGLGQMSYPAGLQPASSFTLGSATTAPQWNLIGSGDIVWYPDPVPYEAIWNAVRALRKVGQYRAANPSAQVQLFLYTPSVGVGNPEDWNYIVMIRN